VEETIGFSICNKPFKPLRLPSERVKSREGLPVMIPTNIIKTLCYCQTMTSTQTHGLHIVSWFNKVNITITSLGHQKSFNSKLKN
jgi:hypothetical protein